VFVGEVDLDIWKYGEERYKEQQLWRERVGLLFLNE
jgi:hypothetical protein